MTTYNTIETDQQVFTGIKSHTQLGDMVVRGIADCVNSAFDGVVTREDALHHMQGDIITVDIDRRSHDVLAFSSTSFCSPNEEFKSDSISNIPGCYLAGATVRKEFQGSGLYKKMNETRIGFALERKLKMVFTRTQNPRVQAGIQKVLGEMKEQGKITDFSLERVLMAGCYPGMLTKEKPVDREVFFDKLDYENGDGYILMFNIEYKNEK